MLLEMNTSFINELKDINPSFEINMEYVTLEEKRPLRVFKDLIRSRSA